jgi:hypothetical protein
VNGAAQRGDAIGNAARVLKQVFGEHRCTIRACAAINPV